MTLVIAHAGHWSLGLLELSPILAVAAFAFWRSRAAGQAAGASAQSASE